MSRVLAPVALADSFGPNGTEHTAKGTAKKPGFQKRKRHGSVVAGVKRARVADRSAHCEVCGWAPPTGLWMIGVRDAESMLHAHHVIPMACGGADHKKNIVLLCPTHHSVAHKLGKMALVPGKRRRSWTGPQTPDTLLSELFLLEQNNARWDEYVTAGRDEPALRHLHADTLAEMRRSTMRAVRVASPVSERERTHG